MQLRKNFLCNNSIPHPWLSSNLSCRQIQWTSRFLNKTIIHSAEHYIFLSRDQSWKSELPDSKRNERKVQQGTRAFICIRKKNIASISSSMMQLNVKKCDKCTKGETCSKQAHSIPIPAETQRKHKLQASQT